jgi:hypothetical protein
MAGGRLAVFATLTFGTSPPHVVEAALAVFAVAQRITKEIRT